MYKIKENIKTWFRHLKLWWRYLVLILFFTCGLMFAKQTLATTYNYNFDDGTLQGTTPVFNSSTSTLYSRSGNYSVELNTSLYKNYGAVDPNKATVISYLFATSSNASFYAGIESTGGTLRAATMKKWGQTYWICRVSFSGQDVEFGNLGTPVLNEWNFFKVIVDKTTDTATCWLNESSISTTTSKIDDFSYVQWEIGGTANSAFVDDIQYTDDVGCSYQNQVNLTHPEDYSMQDKNLLYWAYNFTISSSSYAAYDRFYTYLYYIPPVLDATTTRIEEAWLKPATQPETTYVVIYNNGIYIPLYLGEYAAGVYLTGEKGYDTDILAESDITFTMISSTSTPPTAWCSGLCNDLSTSTSAWWKFWDDTIDKTTTGLTCAGRYFVCYSFYPHTYTQELFGEVYNKFKLVFPFNIFFEITSTIDNVFASTTMASTTGSFGFPMIRKVGTTSQYYILPLLTSSTTSNFLGNSNANLLRFSLSSIIYAFYIVGIILILW